ncbi:hypothetical protein HanXRQr2_Chr10g0423511 [Helianthus annuus]|uniref:Uncharacterized protein n=1 Tax=Helianthus annuus TaxID=4232 RepID=A0A9K3HUQ6_HELAN|nr:hypothetical protein HanXRQr2_Chr10g0423511 [Helianthus annuus]
MLRLRLLCLTWRGSCLLADFCSVVAESDQNIFYNLDICYNSSFIKLSKNADLLF